MTRNKMIILALVLIAAIPLASAAVLYEDDFSSGYAAFWTVDTPSGTSITTSGGRLVVSDTSGTNSAGIWIDQESLGATRYYIMEYDVEVTAASGSYVGFSGLHNNQSAPTVFARIQRNNGASEFAYQASGTGITSFGTWSMSTSYAVKVYYNLTAKTATVEVDGTNYSGYSWTGTNPSLWDVVLTQSGSTPTATIYYDNFRLCEDTCSPTVVTFTALSSSGSSLTYNVSVVAADGSESYNYTNQTGSVTLPFAPNSTKLWNFSTTADNHFSSTLTNQNVSGASITDTLQQWTGIYATDANTNASLNNFTVTYDSTEYDTTTGVVYIPLYNETASVSIDASGYALDSDNLTANPYLQNYTFTLYITNTINVTFKDETTQELINTTTVTAYFTGTTFAYNYTTDNGTLYEELLSPDSYVVTYNAEGYDQREYVFTLTNRSYNELTLYLQNNTNTVTIITTVRDSFNNEVESAVVKAQRKDLSTAQYYEVEDCTTDNEGQCFFNLVEETATYRFLVVVNGVVELTTADKQFVDIDGDGYVTYNLVVNLVEDTNQAIEEAYDVTGSVTYNNNTQTFTYTWSDANNLGVNACLNVVRRIKANRVTLDNTCSDSASGTITYTINQSTGSEFTATGTYTIDGVEYTADSTSVKGGLSLSDDFGALGLFVFGFFIALTAAFTGMWNPIAGPGILVGVLWMLNLLGLIGIGSAAVGSAAAAVMVLVLVMKT